MSKTYRRRPDWEDILVCTNIYDLIDIGGHYEYVKKEGFELKIALALYHSDNYRMGGCDENVPKWYTQMLNRAKRAKSKQRVRNYRTNPDKEMVFELWKKDAGYMYW